MVNPAGDAAPGLPPFVQGILKNFGITPEAIAAYAEIIKGAVLELRSDVYAIKEQNAEIIARQKFIEAKLAEIEHNQLVVTEDVVSIPLTILEDDPSKHN